MLCGTSERMPVSPSIHLLTENKDTQGTNQLSSLPTHGRLREEDEYMH